MAYDIGPVIGIEGEAQFRKAINDINTNMKTLGTEMDAVSSKYDKNDKSAEALTAQNGVLNKQIDEQKQKLDQLKKGLEASADKYGENDKVTQGWQQSVNKATADLNNMERGLKDNNDAMNGFGKETDQATEKAKKLDGALGKLGDGLGKIGGAVGKAAIIGIAAVGTAALAATAAVGAMFNKSIENADSIAKNAEVYGMTAERIQELTYVGTKLDVELTTITGAQTKLTKAMFEAKDGTGAQAEAFAQLGISITDSNGNLKNAKDVMSEAFTSLSKMTNETERDALAMKLFGKSAMELNPLIKAGGEEIAKLTDEARKSGAVLSNEAIEGLDKFGDSAEALKLSVQGIAGSFAVSLLPAMDSLLQFAQGIIPSLQNAIKTGDFFEFGLDLGYGIEKGIKSISLGVEKMLPVVIQILTSLVNAIIIAIPVILPALINAVILLLGALIEIIKTNGPLLIDAGINALVTLIDGIISALPQLVDTAVTLILTLVDGIINLLPKLIPVAINMIVVLVKGIIDALPLIIEKMPLIVETIVNTLVDNLPLLIAAAIQIIIALTIAIIENLPLIIASGKDIMAALIEGVIGATYALMNVVPTLFQQLSNEFDGSSWWQIGSNIISGIAGGVRNAASGLISSVIEAASNALYAVKSFLGIRSPSTVMRDQVGKMIGLGMAEGITDSTRQVDAAMSKLSRGLNADINVNGNGTAVGAAGASGAGNSSSNNSTELTINTPVYLDGKILTNAVSKVQYQNSNGRARGIGVVFT